MTFFPQEALEYHRTAANRPLQRVIIQFPIALKKALYAVAETGYVKSKTWNGCALNRAGSEIKSSVSSPPSAAKAFGINESLVNQFIILWDSLRMSNKSRAELLKTLLLDIGITSPSDSYGLDVDSDIIIFNSLAFKSSQTQFVEELERIKTIADIPKVLQEEMFMASELLSSELRSDDNSSMDVLL